MIEKNVNIKHLSNYKTGGEAEFYCAPVNDEELSDCLKFAELGGLAVTVIGGGYNILVSDDGVKGLVINTSNLNKHTYFEGNNAYAGAGVMIDDLIKECADKGLKGLEDMSGIPGTVGGAVKMNAGAFGTEIKDRAGFIDMMDDGGRIYRVKAEDAGFGYRQASGLKGIVLIAQFILEPGDSAEIKTRRTEILRKRKEKQPLEYPSCGSVFKRPEGNYAGTLIEQCGLKGFQIGGAKVAEKHANFILNVDNATSADIYNVIKHVQDTVEKQTGIRLQREVRLIGFGQEQTLL